jgi:hypothetical protein
MTAIVDLEVRSVLLNRYNYYRKIPQKERLRCRLWGVFNDDARLCLADWLALEVACCVGSQNQGERIFFAISRIWKFDHLKLDCDIDFYFFSEIHKLVTEREVGTMGVFTVKIYRWKYDYDKQKSFRETLWERGAGLDYGNEKLHRRPSIRDLDPNP